MTLHPGDTVRVIGVPTLPCLWYGPNHDIDEPESLTRLRGLVVAVWRKWVAVDLEGEATGTWWIDPEALELL